MKIELPGMREQIRRVYEIGIKEGIAQLEANLEAPKLEPLTSINENDYSRNHLLRENEGWEPPEPQIVRAYLEQLQKAFREEFGTDKKLAHFLGLSGDRRIREFKQGERKVPYGVWRKLLVTTGRVPQEIYPVIGFMS